MPRLGIIGANGQVGAELCLLLARLADLDLVPVCRNQSGSAFLRWKGLECRHGRIADATEAQRLIGDCDVIVNCSLATGTPSQIRRIEDRIATHIAAHSAPNAIVIHFSTQSVYGDPRPNRLIRRRNPYGRTKLATERRVRAAGREFRKPAYILRLGHVCGEMQEISQTIRSQIAADSVVLPERDCSSNTVYTAAIVGAIRQIIGGGIEPGTYDLMNTPRWTWKQVYEYEAQVLGVRFTPRYAGTRVGSDASILRRAMGRLAVSLASRQWLREWFAKLYARLPEAANARAMAWWYVRRARSEIAALEVQPAAAEHLRWVENGTRFFPAAEPTIDLLRGSASVLGNESKNRSGVAATVVAASLNAVECT